MKIQSTVITRIGFTVLTQGLLGVITLFTGIILPRLMGPEQYGYLQKFLFYIGYINILNFGFNDGLLLNYAGIDDADLPKTRIRSAIFYQLIYATLLSLGLMVIALFASNGTDRFIGFMLSFSIIPIFLICISNSICLSLNKSVLYNIGNLLQRFLFCLASIVFLFQNNASAKYMIFSDTIAYFIAMFFLVYFVKDFLFGERLNWKEGIQEIKKLCSTGFTVALSVTIIGLMPSFGRLIVERFESIETYGIYSFYVSILSIILTFTNAVGIVVFPMMKKLTGEHLADSYKRLSLIYTIIGMFMYFAYVPLYLIIKNFLIDYYSGVQLLPILMMLCYPLGKIQAIVVPYYKSYRKEKSLLFLNLIGFCIVSGLTIIGYALTTNVLMIAITSVVSTYIYYTMLEYRLFKDVKGIKSHNKVFDYLTSLIFVFFSIALPLNMFIVAYSIYIIVMLIFLKKRN